MALLLMLCLLLAMNSAHRLLTQSESGMVRFIINGEPVILDETGRNELDHELQARLVGLEEEMQQRLQPWQEAALAEVESDFHAAGEAYLDWYFSLAGSYLRLGVAVTGDLDAWMEVQLQRRLVEPSGLEASLASLREAHAQRLAEAEQAWLTGTLAELQRRHAGSEVDMSETEANELPTVDLDRLVAGAWRDQLDLTRWSATQGAGAAVLIYASARRLSATTAMQGARHLVRHFVTRLGAQAARSAAAGGATAAATAPTGPGALAAGALTAGASLAMAAGSEYLALRAQEAQQRPAMEAGLDNTWRELEGEVKRHLGADRQSRAEALLNHLERRAGQEVKQGELPGNYRILG